MLINEIIDYIELWAPPGAAWERDNIGLQAGDRKDELKNILLALDFNEKVLEEAVKKNCNLIFTHHPFLFNPLKTLDFQNNPKANLIKKLILNKISLFSAHTNLDFTRHGVSFQLAEKLKLKNIDFLEFEKSNQYKLIIFVPEENLSEVKNSVLDAGAGIIGEYDRCTFYSTGSETFRGGPDSSPAKGTKGKEELFPVVRLEVLVDKWRLNSAVNALIKSHPYETPAYDIFPLKNENINYGFGAVGELANPLTKNEFLRFTAKQLRLKNLRFTNGDGKKIKRVAVCGGTGFEYLDAAVKSKAQAFITADVKYHQFQEAEGRILLIDAGHYETEIVVLDEVKRRMEKFILNFNENINVYKFGGTTNPINFLKV